MSYSLNPMLSKLISKQYFEKSKFKIFEVLLYIPEIARGSWKQPWTGIQGKIDPGCRTTLYECRRQYQGSSHSLQNNLLERTRD